MNYRLDKISTHGLDGYSYKFYAAIRSLILISDVIRLIKQAAC